VNPNSMSLWDSAVNDFTADPPAREPGTGPARFRIGAGFLCPGDRRRHCICLVARGPEQVAECRVQCSPRAGRRGIDHAAGPAVGRRRLKPWQQPLKQLLQRRPPPPLPPPPPKPPRIGSGVTRDSGLITGKGKGGTGTRVHVWTGVCVKGGGGGGGGYISVPSAAAGGLASASGCRPRLSALKAAGSDRWLEGRSALVTGKAADAAAAADAASASAATAAAAAVVMAALLLRRRRRRRQPHGAERVDMRSGVAGVGGARRRSAEATGPR
jgi:hypothetical protein